MSGSGFNTHRPSKCMFGKCDWPYDTWHICVIFTGPEPVPPKHNGPVWSEAEKKEIGERVSANAREKTRERDLKVVELYIEEKMTLREVADEIGIAYQTARGVILRNNIAMRPKGRGNR